MENLPQDQSHVATQAGPAPETPAQPVEKTGQEYFTELRHWIAQHCSVGHSIRQAAYQMSLTAIVHRLIKYGPDETLNHLTARDLLNLLFFTNGELAEWIMRAAFTRALIEDDREVYERLAQGPLIIECVAWYWKLVQGICGATPNPQELTEWVENLPIEEKSLARLMVARVFPDTVHMDWLFDVPEHCPAIAFQLARIAALKTERINAVEAFVRERPLVRNQAFN